MQARKTTHLAAAALLALAAGATPEAGAAPAGLAQRTYTVVEGAAAVSGGEQACFRLVDTRADTDRLLVRIRFQGRVPRGRVILDGVSSESFVEQAEEFSFVVDPRGTHQVRLDLQEKATVDRLSVTSTTTSLVEESCSTYEERRNDVDLEGPAEPSTNKLGRPEATPPSSQRNPPPPPSTSPSRDESLANSGTVAAGTKLELTLQGAIDTRSAYAGQTFLATLDHGVVGTNGRVLLPAGPNVEGHVAESQDAGRFGRSNQKLAFDRARLSDGTSVPIAGTLQTVGKGSAKKQTGIIAGSAVGGAILGKILGGDDKDAAIGAVLGGAIAAGSIAAKPGESIVLPAGTSIEITLDSAAEVYPANRR